MNLSELIAKLEELKNAQGDVKVKVLTWEDNALEPSFEKPEVWYAPPKDQSEGFVIVSPY